RRAADDTEADEEVEAHGPRRVKVARRRMVTKPSAAAAGDGRGDVGEFVLGAAQLEIDGGGGDLVDDEGAGHPATAARRGALLEEERVRLDERVRQIVGPR